MFEYLVAFVCEDEAMLDLEHFVVGITSYIHGLWVTCASIWVLCQQLNIHINHLLRQIITLNEAFMSV